MISAHTVAGIGISALIAVITTAFGAAAVAAELPADTNEIKHLTPAQARAVVRSAFSDDLRRRFPHLTEFEISSMTSNKEIVKCDESMAVLGLNGLTELDHETAKELAQFKGRLQLNGLAALDPRTAKELAQFKGRLLQLNGLATLDPQTAKVLSEGSCNELQCDGLQSLNCDAARALARAKIRACRLPLTEMDPATAKEIARFQGLVLSFPRFADLNADIVQSMAGYWGCLILGGVTTLDADTAKAFEDFKGECIALPGLATLSVDTAAALAAADKWDGSLPAIDAFDFPQAVAVAEALAKRKGPLCLSNLKKISPKALSALLKKKHIQIPVIDALELIPEQDGAHRGPRAPQRDLAAATGASQETSLTVRQ
jgi:hypothetical protein